MEENILPVRITSTILWILGTGSNFLVILLSKGSSKDAKCFVLLMRIHAALNMIHSTTGWLVTMRHAFSGIVLFIVYGFGGYLGPRFCALIDSFAIQGMALFPMMISLMMLVRTLILHDVVIKQMTVIGLFLAVYLLTLPRFIASFISYQELPAVRNFTPHIEKETKFLTAYTMVFAPFWSTIFSLYNHVPIVAFVFTVICRILLEWQLRKFSEFLTSSVRKLHARFMHLLTIDSCVVFLFFLTTYFNFFAHLTTIWPQLEIYFTLYNYHIFMIPGIIQGFSTLWLVPYLRNSLKKHLKITKTTKVSTIVIIDHDSSD